MKASIVAWYGDKTAAFASWLAALQTRLEAVLGSAFRPYDLAQLHATLVDVSQEDGSGAMFRELHGRDVACELNGFEAWLAEQLRDDVLRVRFGGVIEDSAWTSRGRPRADRRFSIQGDKVVLIGWTDTKGCLDTIRRGAERFGFLHRYHASPDAIDDDCYIRLGCLDASFSASQAEIEAIERDVRSSLDGSSIDMLMTARDLRIAHYVDETLPPSTTRTRQLVGA